MRRGGTSAKDWGGVIGLGELSRGQSTRRVVDEEQLDLLPTHGKSASSEEGIATARPVGL